MTEKIAGLSDEIWNWIIKILIPTIFGLSISIAIQVKNRTANMLNIILSIIIGVSCSYLTGAWVLKAFSPEMAPIVIGIITIGGEKIGYWIIYKFKFDKIGDSAVKFVSNKFKK